jgi:ABC-2 type transport system ATP-binding protein
MKNRDEGIMLEVIHLSKKYRKTLAVDDISFMVKPGQVGILLGPNGAGKSTIIKCISGLLRYDGQVRINGWPLESVEARKQFAYIPEIPGL